MDFKIEMPPCDITCKGKQQRPHPATITALDSINIDLIADGFGDAPRGFG